MLPSCVAPAVDFARGPFRQRSFQGHPTDPRLACKARPCRVPSVLRWSRARKVLPAVEGLPRVLPRVHDQVPRPRERRLTVRGRGGSGSGGNFRGPARGRRGGQVEERARGAKERPSGLGGPRRLPQDRLAKCALGTPVSAPGPLPASCAGPPLPWGAFVGIWRRSGSVGWRGDLAGKKGQPHARVFA